MRVQKNQIILKISDVGLSYEMERRLKRRCDQGMDIWTFAMMVMEKLIQCMIQQMRDGVYLWLFSHSICPQIKRCCLIS